MQELEAKFRSSYGPLAYFSDIFILEKTTFLPEMKISKNMQADHNLNGL